MKKSGGIAREVSGARRRARPGHRAERGDALDHARDCRGGHAFIRSVRTSDVAWFERNLSHEFLNSNADGTLVGYTDVWLRQGERWVCVSVDVSRG